MGDQGIMFLLDQAPVVTLLLVIAFAAQALKEIGVPSPGVTQGLLILAGNQLFHGNATLGSIIILLVLLGSLAGACSIYIAGRICGVKLLDKYGKYIRITPRVLEKARTRRLSCPAMIMSRAIPGLMAATSLTAGTLRLSAGSFLVAVALSTLAWITILVGLGSAFGGIVTGPMPAQYASLVISLLVVLIITAGLFLSRGIVLKKA